MQKLGLGLGLMLTFSLVACKKETPCEPNNKYCEEEGLCEKSEKSEESKERCKVGEGKCVVGYDGDCERGQVCYAGEGAPKGKPGTCTDGQFDANGKWIAVVSAENFIQGERSVGATDAPWMKQRDCFASCPVAELMPPLWLGKAPATLKVTVQGPQAETEQLKAKGRGVEHENCVATGSSPGKREWTCHFPQENWAGENTRESLKLELWTENSKDFPWISSYQVDTKPLELDLKLEVKHGLDAGDSLEATVYKRGTDKEAWAERGAPLEKVEYLSLEVIGDNGDIQSTSGPISCHLTVFQHAYGCPTQLATQVGTFTLRATGVKATDLAGNEVSHAELTTTLKP